MSHARAKRTRGWVEWVGGLRRSFATWLARAGVERAVRKLLLGHIEGDVTEEHHIERDLAMLYHRSGRITI
jgi:integrase